MSFETSLPEGLVMDFVETEEGFGKVSRALATDIWLVDPPDWLSWEKVQPAGGPPSLELTAVLRNSPFRYRVHSIDEQQRSQTVDDFDRVRCDQHTWHYERIDHGVLNVDIAVEATFVDPETHIESIDEGHVSIRIRADYSIGRDMLVEKIECQR